MPTAGTCRRSISAAFNIATPDSAARAAEQLVRELALEAVVITLDCEGAYLKTKDIAALIPTRPRSVYDVPGAGDMVLAALAVTLAEGHDYVAAVELANRAAGLEVEKLGNATATKDEIINDIFSKDRRRHGK